MARRIVLDTDMGSDVDDALCLALALASPEVELVAVTHVTQDTHFRARISRRLLEMAGRGEVPVFAGRGAPFDGSDSRFVWFGNEGKGIIDEAGDELVEEEDAVDALLRLLDAEPGLEVVAVGPMTNLAAALDCKPEIASSIGMLTIMGGHVREIAYSGKVLPPGVDYNLCSDAAASLRVLRCGAPTRLVTGDVTLKTWMTNRDLQRLEAAGGELRGALAAAIREWTPIMYRLFGGGDPEHADANVAFLHDPLALASVFDESFCRFEDLEIEPVMVDGVFRTLERGRAAPDTFTMRCAVDVDASRFRDFFVERVVSF